VNKLITISDLSKKLNLVNQHNKKPQNYIIRYWEKEFKQIKPKIINKRRFYTNEQVELIRFIKYLLKEKGLTINGVKNVLKNNRNQLDDHNSVSLKAEYLKENIKIKSKNILRRLKNLKKDG
tara:strand:- start:228 stop:593 length:366 start_codon:yes stop_codon:yes gene_type:complete